LQQMAPDQRGRYFRASVPDLRGALVPGWDSWPTYASQVGVDVWCKVSACRSALTRHAFSRRTPQTIDERSTGRPESPCSNRYRAACVRFDTPSFRYALTRWNFTVHFVTQRHSAICALV